MVDAIPKGSKTQFLSHMLLHIGIGDGSQPLLCHSVPLWVCCTVKDEKKMALSLPSQYIGTIGKKLSFVSE